jgi:glycosyltransferase involved in cell wall biosynthesis
LSDGISVIIPVLNSGSLRALHQCINDFALEAGFDVETVFVDDASTDASLDVLHDIKTGAANVIVKAHPTNCGQAAALLTGISLAHRDILVTLDDDMQYQPRDIPLLLTALQSSGPNGLAMGYLKSWMRPVWREVAGICANTISNLFLPKPLPLRMTTFCAFRRHLIANIPVNGSHERALFAELIQVADKIILVPIVSEPGKEHPSRYRFASLWRLFMSRARCYKIARVVAWCAFCSIVSIASGALVTARNPILSWAAGGICLTSAACALLLGALAKTTQLLSNEPKA